MVLLSSETKDRRRGRERSRRPAASPLNILMVLTVACLLVVAVTAFRGAASTAPALSPGLRIVGPNGDWRPQEGFGLYDRSDYFTERALAFLTSEDALNAGSSAPILAAEMGLGAIRTAPADAYAWTVLATVSAANGLVDFARVALDKSRALAPNTVGLTIERLRLVGLQEAPLTPETRTAVVHDLVVAREKRGAELNALFELLPSIAEPLSRLEAEETAAEAERAAAAAALSATPSPEPLAESPPPRARRGGRTATTPDPG